MLYSTMMSICVGSVVGGVVVTDMVGDIGTGVVVVVYWTRAVGGVHSQHPQLSLQQGQDLKKTSK